MSMNGICRQNTNLHELSTRIGASLFTARYTMEKELVLIHNL